VQRVGHKASDKAASWAGRRPTGRPLKRQGQSLIWDNLLFTESRPMTRSTTLVHGKHASLAA